MPRFELFKKNHNENISRKIFCQLHGREKLQYIWDYYKFPIFTVCILLYIAGYIIYGHFTHKDVLLSTAFVNVTPGDTLAEKLGSGFLDYMEEMVGKRKSVFIQDFISQTMMLTQTMNTPMLPG